MTNMITIFIQTEIRPPEKGEWFIDKYGEFMKAAFDFTDFHQIVEKHEIEVPEGADRLNYHFDNRRNCGPAIGCGHIDIPRKKVKKWFIEMTTSREQIITPKESYTDEEIRHLMDDYPYTKFRRTQEIEE
jgi:hypothetical protein